MNKSVSILNGEILPVNAKSVYSFYLQELQKITLQDWPPPDFKRLGWDEAQEEIHRHWDILSKTKIWSPYPIHAYCVGSSEAPSLINALSGNDKIVSSLLQQDINEYLKVKVRYFLFPLADSHYQHHAIAQLICETMPNGKIGELNAWVDALREDELNPENVKSINLALKGDL